MAEFQGGSKRKDRGSDSAETKVCSSEGKKAYQEANEKSVANETSGEMLNNNSNSFWKDLKVWKKKWQVS